MNFTVKLEKKVNKIPRFFTQNSMTYLNYKKKKFKKSLTNFFKVLYQEVQNPKLRFFDSVDVFLSGFHEKILIFQFPTTIFCRKLNPICSFTGGNDKKLK